MYLSKDFAKELVKLGFTRPDYYDQYNPFDFYNYRGEEWVVGGRILPEGTLSVSNEIYLKGTWLPSLDDMMSWFEDNNFIFDLSYDGDVYRISATDESKISYKGKGVYIETSCFNVIKKILLKNPKGMKKREYEVYEIESIGGLELEILDTAKAEGKEEGMIEVAKKLLKKGMAFEDIADTTELSVERIKELARGIGI